MSAIFGIVNFNQKPVKDQDLRIMQKAMSYWGPDGKYLWREESAALGQLQLFNSPESLTEIFPLIDKDRGLVFVSAARIDNREDLFLLLDIPLGLRASITDAEIIFAVYKKLGNECIHHLLGDWTFAVWNTIEKKLFLARDHHGISGIYYYNCQDYLVFASSLKGLLALPQIPKRINELRIAQVLISWPGDGVQTAYLDILRLPPSHTLSASRGKVDISRYWYAENINPLNYKNDTDYIDHFKELFTDAVHCRLRTHGKVGSTLSSGLDSSSVSAVAANLLKEKNIQLPVFTAIPLFDCQDQIPPHRLANEGPLAAKLVAFNGNMEHYLVNSKNTSVLEGIEKMLWIHDQPFHAAANAYWIIDMIESIQRLGCNVLLTGQFGNGTISWPTPQYTNRILTPAWPVFSLQNLTHLSLFKKNVVKPAIPTFLINYYHRLAAGLRPWESHAALNRAFAAKIQLHEQMKRAGFDTSFSKIKKTSTMQLEIIKPGQAIVGQQWLEIGAAFGIEVRDPSMDKRIIEFCLAVPDRIYLKENKSRMLIREAMQGLLPEELLWNKQRGLQSADITLRIQSDKEKWMDITRNISQNSTINNILDIKIFHDSILSISKGKQFNPKGVNKISRGAMVKSWLDQFDANK